MSCSITYNSHRSTDDEEELEPKDAEEPVIQRITSKSGVSIEAPSIDLDEHSEMSKTSCHDSGIDIRETIPVVPMIPTKKVSVTVIRQRFFSYLCFLSSLPML